ncbi:hypothetical protein [Microbulbifer marinus]|nr:hypothetical protein [Microbulbifer marinus]
MEKGASAPFFMGQSDIGKVAVGFPFFRRLVIFCWSMAIEAGCQYLFGE